ncbi:MAG: hypothetical protein RLZZ32_969 [Cyanobacteriota bacterium]|jgi:hypothetical protein
MDQPFTEEQLLAIAVRIGLMPADASSWPEQHDRQGDQRHQQQTHHGDGGPRHRHGDHAGRLDRM